MKEKTTGDDVNSGAQRVTKMKREKREQEREGRKADWRGVACMCFCSFQTLESSAIVELLDTQVIIPSSVALSLDFFFIFTFYETHSF